MVAFFAIFLVGLILGLLGGGGSILGVPILTYLFGQPATTATAYSLFVVGISSLVGTLRYFPQRLVDFRRGAYFLLPSLLGVTVSRRVILPSVPKMILQVGHFELTKDRLVLLVFAGVMLWAAYAMLRKNKKTDETRKERGSPLLIGVYGLGAGALMGFVGAGGGFLIIPVLVGLAHLEMRPAIGTSLFIIAVSSLFGFVSDVIAGFDLDHAFALKLAAVSVLGVWMGTSLSARISGKKLKLAFGVLVAAIALVILIKETLVSLS